MDQADPSDRDLVDALKRVLTGLHARLEEKLRPSGLPAPQAVALHRIDGSLSMKDLGRQMRCDASFVTSIADALEERGLVKREIDREDRRIKNLVLTRKGVAVRERLAESFHSLPQLRALDPDDRRELHRLLTKMVDADDSCGCVDPGTDPTVRR